MNAPELSSLFYKELRKVGENRALTNAQKLQALRHLMVLLFQEFSHRDRLSFSSLYARMAYVCQIRVVPKRLQFALHHFRKVTSQALASTTEPDEHILHLGMQILADAISRLFEQPIPEYLHPHLKGESIYPTSTSKAVAFKRKIRVVATGDDPQNQQLLVLDGNHPGATIRVQYGLPERNENFNSTIQLLRQVFEFPVTVNLIDVEIDKDGIFRPRALVVEPDFLIDVSAVAECFKPDGTRNEGYLMRKFLPFEYKPPLMLGNMANFFLDELMSNPELSFKEIIGQVFELNPLAFSLYDDATIMRMVRDAQLHYSTIKQMVLEGFQKHNIEPAGCNLEPTFYSEIYGLQGRLDLFYRSETNKWAIVELKSGKSYRPNTYGINRSHFVQTLLYDLMVKSIYGKDNNPINYILYSGIPEKPLRFAPSVTSEQMEALQLRNQLIAIEYELSKLGDFHTRLPKVFSRLRGAAVRGFLKRDLDDFLAIIDTLSPLEMQYFTAFTGFIAREHRLAKMGDGNSQGQAALWLQDVADKKEQFAIIHNMKLVKNEAHAEKPRLYFAKATTEKNVAKFRQGDICVLYPMTTDSTYAPALKDQVFKCSVEQIDNEQLTLRLRARQFNQQLLDSVESWSIEQDMFDGSYSNMYQQLFIFFKSPQPVRDLWLAKTAPREPSAKEVIAPTELTKEQQQVFQEVICANDYYLLWGPPGTGKTSKMLKHITAYLYEHTKENILLLAYTNKAVDEICHALESHIEESSNRGKPLEYIRIGSNLGCDERFRSKLMQEQTRGLQKRKDLLKFLKRHRVYVATVSSLHNKQELLKIIRFDRIIVDEASQLLEPMLLGLLSKFEKALLIGDHRQLPAVVTQDQTYSKVNNPGLQALGLQDMRESLFERLYKRAQAMNWSWAYGKLSHQGRMHRDIMQFPNEHFYGGFLDILPDEISFSTSQKERWNSLALSDVPTKSRVSFVPVSEPENLTSSSKINTAEAIEVCNWVRSIYNKMGDAFTENTLGIITPYRAQIIHIQEKLSQANLPVELITIDTVERFQGGARDVIMISLCTNQSWQLQRLVSLSSEGIDRKFNVALTRARKQLVVFGNPKLLSEQKTYSAFVDKYSI